MKKETKKAFTLAEIMIALVVIGVITSILLPVAFNSVPDENVMKFKKGNAALAKVINELVTSGEYYKEGDLGIKQDGTLLTTQNLENNKNDTITYFCKTFADVISTKKVNCSTYDYKWSYNHLHYYTDGTTWRGCTTDEDYLNFLDKGCKENIKVGEEIISSDGIVYYQTNPTHTFGIYYEQYGSGYDDETWDQRQITDERLFKDKTNSQGINEIYKIFCMDIDGIGKGEDPFGYGIRVDVFGFGRKGTRVVSQEYSR